MTDAVHMRVIRGGLVPADEAARLTLRERGLRLGDLVSVRIVKPRDSVLHRRVHAIGRLVSENVEDFAGMGAHDVVKRLQLETGIECDDQIIDIPGVGKCLVKTARSIAFDKMDDTRFRELARALCRHIADTYWRGCTSEQIEQMAQAMVDES